MLKDFITGLEKALREELPGRDYQYQMAPAGRMPEASFTEIQEAGVLLCIYQDNQKLNTIFIKRPNYQGHHSGQVSLPGGKKDRTDKDLVQTALREAQEEVNLQHAIVIGTLTPLFIPVSGYEVLPVVGYVEQPPALIPEPGEVDYIIRTPLQDLFAEENRKWKYLDIQGEKRKIPYFDIYNEHIWGATAMILGEFCEILKRNDLLKLTR